MLEKWISILLVPFLFLQTMLPAFFGNRNEQSFSEADTANLHSLHDYVAYVEEHGAPSFSTDTFVKQAKPLADTMRALSGRPLYKPENRFLNTTIDDTLTEVCNYVARESGLDLVRLIGSVPDLNAPAEFGAEVLHVNTTELREMFFRLRDKAYDSNLTWVGYVLYLLGVYYSVIRAVNFYAIPADDPDEVEVMMDIVYDDGDGESMHPGIFINQKTGHVRGWTDKGLIDVGFDFNVKDVLIYGAVHAWQRALGFDRLYDLLANSTPLFNMSTRRFHFDAHGKEWMIQIWKGNYGLVTNGVEVGVYNRPKGSLGTHYNAAGDDELMLMEASLYHGDTLLFHCGPMMHWWMSAFKLSKVIYQPKDLTMAFSITFPDQEMADAFAKSIDDHGAHDVTYTMDGLTVHAVF